MIYNKTISVTNTTLEMFELAFGTVLPANSTTEIYNPSQGVSSSMLKTFLTRALPMLQEGCQTGALILLIDGLACQDVPSFVLETQAIFCTTRFVGYFDTADFYGDMLTNKICWRNPLDGKIYDATGVEVTQ